MAALVLVSHLTSAHNDALTKLAEAWQLPPDIILKNSHKQHMAAALDRVATSTSGTCGRASLLISSDGTSRL